LIDVVRREYIIVSDRNSTIEVFVIMQLCTPSLYKEKCFGDQHKGSLDVGTAICMGVYVCSVRGASPLSLGKSVGHTDTSENGITNPYVFSDELATNFSVIEDIACLLV
jgi:hypothetical protein